MNNWKEVKLGDVCEISSSKRIFAKEYQSTGIPFYRGKEIIEKYKGNDISTELFISKTRFNEIKDKFGAPKKNDILLTSVGTLGIPYIVRDETFYFKDGNLTWLKNFDKTISKFIFYWITSPVGQNQIDSKSIGSTQKALTIDTLKNFAITLPPLPEQKAIADTLSCLDDKIELNNKINKNLEAQAQAIFKSWFVDFEPFQDGEFVDSELGRIPKGWKVGTLGEVVKLFDFKRIPLSSRVRENMSKIYPYYGATSLMDYVEAYIFDGLYILLGEDGTVVDANGYPILQYVWGKFWVNNHAHIMKGANGFSEDSLYMLLKNTSIQSIVTGAVQLKINQGNLKAIKILIPDSATISKYNNILKPVFACKRSLFEENQALTALRDTLLPKLMSGELRVPPSQSIRD